ncbi:hypothetical protein H696_05595 [Fonticula alba]|uniref:RRM domain-containing protein n=1 Tax=Fonticula alba TaxID=691883 RepID=A0A058Z0T1_FONAL|nr:hypothetical protein H696_05595 [Fonticula alba]KCV67865.1 hypothetical protein H696_05595 [Fonticula alba]|eukprot:XP_009497685.1 hypothetical protein H696_05595 [Fonticula alba]
MGAGPALAKRLGYAHVGRPFRGASLSPWKWRKFGRAANHPPGPQFSTTGLGEPITFRMQLSTRVEEENDASRSMVDSLRTNDGVSCRICRGSHFTAVCPHRDNLGVINQTISLDPTQMEDVGKTPAGRYVPPIMRGRMGAGSNEPPAYTIRVSNLSEFMYEDALRTLFAKCGIITRIFLATDRPVDRQGNIIRNSREPPRCKGYAFVSYLNKADAERAIQEYNKYGLDNLIMEVDWARSKDE